MARFDQLISHRFRGFAERESTMDGLIAALDAGVQQIEFDIRMTRCGTPLVTHDEAARTADGRLIKICDVLAADLGQMGGDFSHMPHADTLFSAIAAHDNRSCKLLIDVKDAGFEEMLYALCARYALRHRVLWVSWLPEVLFAVNDIDDKASLCLSHWCRLPDPVTRSVHKVFEAPDGSLQRPGRTFVHGERSGWYLAEPLDGPLLSRLSWICVPATQIGRDTVEYYHRHGIQVSAFSYMKREAIETAEDRFGHDAFFCDDREPFDRYSRSLAGS